jgi:hypothetical protein
MYYVQHTEVPKDVTDAQILRMTPGQQEQLMKTRYKFDVQVSCGEVYVVLPETLRVNHQIPKQRFVFDYPPGSRYYNAFTKEFVQVPGERPKRATDVPESAPSGRSGFVLFLVGNVLAIGTLVGAIWWYRRKRSTR